MEAERVGNREGLLRDGSSTSPGTWSMARDHLWAPKSAWVYCLGVSNSLFLLMFYRVWMEDTDVDPSPPRRVFGACRTHSGEAPV